jgi:hypothetical protein
VRWVECGVSSPLFEHHIYLYVSEGTFGPWHGPLKIRELQPYLSFVYCAAAWWLLGLILFSSAELLERNGGALTKLDKLYNHNPSIVVA